MSPFRWEVLLVGFLLALPVVGLGLRGDLSTEEVMTRVLWCLGAGWAVVAVLSMALTPPNARPQRRSADPASTDPATEGEHSPAV
jgi:hypothetical protein